MPRDYESPRRDRDRNSSRDRHRERDGGERDGERERQRQRQRRRDDSRQDDRDRDPERRRRRTTRDQSDREYDTDRSQQQRRRRRGHRATDSSGDPILLRQPERSYDSPYHSSSPSPTKARQHNHRRSHGGGGYGGSSRDSGGTDTPGSRNSAASNRPLLHADALAQLNQLNAKSGWKANRYDEDYLREVREQERDLERDRQRDEKKERRKTREEAKEREKRRRYEQEMGFRRSRPVDPELEDEDDGEGEQLPPPPAYGDDGIRVRGHDDGFEPYTDEPYTDDPDEARRMRRRREYTDDEREERRRRRKEKALAASALPGKNKKSRVVSGPLLEEGGKEEYEYNMAHRGGGVPSSDEYYDQEQKKKKWKKLLIILGVSAALLAIIIPVAVVVSKKKGGDNSSTSSSSGDSTPDNSNLNGMSENDIPEWARGGLLDPFTWYDTEDFNVTFTNDTVGGLSVMGLNMTWDDSVQANENVPALNEEFKYGDMPIRGVNVGGWLNIEPFITPSFFESYSTRDNVIDEWTLTTSMGPTKAKTTLEKHYSSWITKQTMIDIRNAGFDHVRIPFNYWAVTTYDDDPYVAKISWRYLLRGIEWARQQGLRVNLDLHGIPGSQNGWNHSGRQGAIGWLNGTNGDVNAQRSIDIHNQLSQFFSQPRYKNIITLYGLVNEPRMVDIDTNTVLSWYDKVIPVIRKNNLTSILVFGDGFYGLDNWQGKLQNYDNLLLDVHQYVIFNVDLIKFSHSEKINYACAGWTKQSKQSMDKATGFGPTMCGEWSQADTDCTQYINNVGWGTRWEGTYNTGNTSTSVLTPTCPTDNNPTCSCDNALADPSDYSDAYKQFLLDFALAQIYSFEQAWGWFYWTWKTEKAVQWSWESGMAAGILPSKVWDRSAFSCNTSTIPDYASMGLAENY